jgi:cyclopropane fatty-acyl-phospholipid synthase-like methyltransferase
MKISDFVEVKNPRVASRYQKNKVAIGDFIEDYINGKVDINTDFKEMLQHKDEIFSYQFVGHHYKFLISRFLPEVLSHSKKQDERIVRSHYDNKNDLFNWFLGPKMIYTSCYFLTGKESLEEAQENKMNLIAQKIQLKPGENLLDIGCGWGTLVAHMAKHYGADTTGVTIAQAGVDWGMKQIYDNGVEDRARIWRKDYRDIPNDKKYDKVTCLEMAEHVGVKNFRKFMKQCYSLLKDDGIFYLQIAGLRERDSLFTGPIHEDLVWGLFMNEYIFSGADASMPLNWDLKHIERSGFEIHSIENIGIHYSKTIEYWYKNWMSNKDKVLEKYGERIFRIYTVFLGWSIYITVQGSSTAYQIVCRKNLNTFDRTRFMGAKTFGEKYTFRKAEEPVTQSV